VTMSSNSQILCNTPELRKDPSGYVATGEIFRYYMVLMMARYDRLYLLTVDRWQ